MSSVPPILPQWSSSDDSITEHTPLDEANHLVSFRASMVEFWALVTMAFAFLAAVLTKLSVYTPGGSTLVSTFSHVLVFPAEVFYLVSSALLLWEIRKLLIRLRDRAQYFRPQLSRSATDVHTMHMWPVRNMFGPVQALVETGVTAARGPGWLFWPVGYFTWIVGLIWFLLADGARAHFQALVLLTVSAFCMKLAASLLQRVLKREETYRLIPPGSARGNDDAFWSRGIIDTAPKPETRIVDVPIDDGIDKYYRRED